MMSHTTTTRRWTTADLKDLPDDDQQYEIIDGELHVTRAPHVWHQIVVGRVGTALEMWSNQTGAGITIPGPGVIFSPTDALIPDLVWVSRDRFPGLLGEDGKLHGAPDLVIEVLSPGPTDEERDRVTKRQRYHDRGVREYWIVDRFARTIEIYRFDEGLPQPIATLGEQDELSSPLLPEFSYRIGTLFAGLPRS